MSTRQTIPAEARAVLEEILEVLQAAEPDAIDWANDKELNDKALVVACVAGYLGATVKHQAARLERLLERDAPPPEKAKAP